MSSADLPDTRESDLDDDDNDVRWRFVQSAPIQHLVGANKHRLPAFAYFATCCSYALLLLLGIVADWIRYQIQAEHQKDLVNHDVPATFRLCGLDSY